MKKITKEELIKEFKEIGKDFKNPLEITRNAYRKVTKYHSAYENYFKTFSDFRKEAFGLTEEDVYKIDLEKKEELIKEFKEIGKKFKNPLEITRAEYVRDSKFKYTYDKFFKSFDAFKKEVFEITEEDEKKFDLEKKVLILENKNRELEKEKEMLLKSSISEDTIIEDFEKLRLKEILPQKINLTNIKLSSNKEAVFVVSDIHCGEVVKAEEVGGANEYNIEIMKERLDRIFKYACYYCKQTNVSIMNLIFDGDLLSGSIHDELPRSNECSEVEGLFILQEYISNKLLEIESIFSKINVHFLVGNHSRLTKKPETKQNAILNWEYVLAKQLHILFNTMQKEKNKKIFINYYQSPFTVLNITGHKFLVTHGHLMMGKGSGGFAGIPYYALSASSAKMYGVLKQIGCDESVTFDSIIMGHLHFTGEINLFNGGTLYMNASVIGTSEYGLYNVRAIGKVEQTLLILEEGKVNTKYILRGNE